MQTILKCAALGATLLAFGATPAHADGLPVLGVEAGAAGITLPGSSVRYVTLAARKGTVVAAVAKAGGGVQRQMFFREILTIPAVAYDGTPAGLSRNGRWLVLLRPRLAFPQRRTHLVVLDAGNLRVHRRIDLRGDFSFDALSPDGRTAFVIHYTSKQDFTRYEVRALDLQTGRLTPHRIVDPREPDEAMQGMPMTRATSADGRWAFTLYDGLGKAPFIHALDTTHRTARCIDLKDIRTLAGRNGIGALSLGVAGNRLVISAPHGPLLTVDRSTWRAAPYVAPAAGGVPAGHPASASADTTSLTWPGVAVLAALVAAAGAAFTLRARRRAGHAPGPVR